jgi:hypothetical protein
MPSTSWTNLGVFGRRCVLPLCPGLAESDRQERRGDPLQLLAVLPHKADHLRLVISPVCGGGKESRGIIAEGERKALPDIQKIGVEAEFSQIRRDPLCDLSCVPFAGGEEYTDALGRAVGGR